jgi:tetratricopeptide (TPR) repeat protein
MMVDLDSLRHQGEAAWGAGHWELAQAAYAAIVEAEPADPVASGRLLECMLALGEPDQAVEVMEELLDRVEARGDLEGALAVTESLLSLSVDDPTLALERSVRLHFRLGDEAAGMTRLRQLSDFYLDRKRTEEAMAVFQRAQSEYPECVEIGMELGHLLIALGFVDEGAEQFRQLGHRTLDHNLEEAIEAFRRWDFLKRLEADRPPSS